MRLPILLVPGWSDGARALDRLRARFVGAGWPEESVHAHEFVDRYGSNVTHATEIRAAVDELLDRTGADALDIVAHSMGGLATRYMFADSGERGVRRAVFMATPHRGTWFSYVAWGGGSREMRPRGEFIVELDRHRPTVLSLSLYTPLDSHVVPQSSAAWDSGETHRVWCGHRGFLKREDVFVVIRDFLQRADSRGGA